MIKLASPDIRKYDIQKAVNVLISGDLIQGINVSCFEKDLVDFTGVPYSVVVSSCTAALHLSLKALNIRKGDCVILPAFTFPATANVVEIVGAEIILTDVCNKSYVMTPEILEKTIIDNKNKNIKAILVVHEFGFPANVKEISKIAKKNNLYLIEDGACALGTIANGCHIGHFSDIACFSFHPRKAITSGEGGAVLTSNKIVADRVRILMNHGIYKTYREMDFIEAGLNYRMTDFQAALIIGQLKRFSYELTRRSMIAKKYIYSLQDEKLLRLPQCLTGHSWQSFMIVLDEQINREKTIARMLEKGIQTNIGAHAINLLSYYKKKYTFSNHYYPNAIELFQKGLVLPIYGKLKMSEVSYIIKSLRSILND